MKPFEKIYTLVAKIPKEKVMTYKQIAKLAKISSPKIVGFALHANKNPGKIPCHRVIKSDGTLAKGYAFGGSKIQKKLLESEGISFSKKGKVDLEKHLYKPKENYSVSLKSIS